MMGFHSLDLGEAMTQPDLKTCDDSMMLRMMLTTFHWWMHHRAPNLLNGLFDYVRGLDKANVDEVNEMELAPIFYAYRQLVKYGPPDHLKNFNKNLVAKHDPDVLLALAERACQEEDFFDYPTGLLQKCRQDLTDELELTDTETAAWHTLSAAYERFHEFLAYLALQHPIGQEVLKEHRRGKRARRRPLRPHRSRGSANLRLVVSND